MENSKMATELAYWVTLVESMNPWMTKSEVIDYAVKVLRKEKPSLFEKDKDLGENQLPRYVFELNYIMVMNMLRDYFISKDPTISKDKALDKADAVYRAAEAVYIYPDRKRDLEAEDIMREAVIKPYEAKREADIKLPPELANIHLNDPEPAVVDKAESNPAPIKETKSSKAEEVKVESKPEEMEANFDPTNPALNFFQSSVQQYPVNPVFTQPIHKVDEPPKAPKPVIPEDNVQSNLNQVNFGGLMKPAPIQQVPDVIGHKLTNPEMVVPVTENICNNDVIISKFPKIPLKQIEQIANTNGVSVLFEEYPWSNLISVTALDAFGQVVAPKCFVIDTGMIIDPRAKLIATNPKINPNVPLELAQMFELFVIDTKNHNRKLLDEKLINDIFIGGLLNISKKEMYSAEYKKLNTKVALITMPTKGITKEMRNALQEYLMKMDEHGDFDKAIAMSPNGCRFLFNTDRLDRDHLSDFTMINEGVPLFYGTRAPAVNPTIIESKDGKVSIRAGRA